MERATGTEVYGCGSSHSTDITLNIQTTTGGNFSVSLSGKHTVEHLKKLVSKKLKVSKDRICLLHRERQLTDGTLEENGLLDGARVILLPSVETGLLSQRSENSVMQALESLNDTQVNDFLSGKSPLNLTMRLGDHMMLIQLQLSTLNSPTSGGRTSRMSIPAKTARSSPVGTPGKKEKGTSTSQTPEKPAQTKEAVVDKKTDNTNISEECPPPPLQEKDLEKLKNAFKFFRSMAKDKYGENVEVDIEKNSTIECADESFTNLSVASADMEQSPIKSLSNLVSSPLHTSASETKKHLTSKSEVAFADTVKTSLIDMLSSDVNGDSDKMDTDESSTSCLEKNDMADKSCATSMVQPPDSPLSDDSETATELNSFLTESTIDEYPMENLFNNAVDKGLLEEQDDLMDREISNLVTTSHGTQDSSAPLPFQTITEPLKTKRFHCLLQKTSKFKHPIGQSKQRAFMQSIVNKHKKKMQSRQDVSQPSTSRSEAYLSSPRKLILQPSSSQEEPQPSTSRQIAPVAKTTDGSKVKTTAPDTKTLLEASKNLTQTLKKLSKEVLTNKIDFKSAEEKVRSKIGPGAVIESMKHHGKGIYSGTFSGTLNPALQDRFGRPKRDISTIIHILNDLLCAHPPIALSQAEPKHACIAGKSSSSSDAKCCATCAKKSCTYGQCDGHPSTSAATKPSHCLCSNKDQNCLCKTRLAPIQDCPNCKENTGEMCKRCNSAKTLESDNTKTKGKLEQLRLVMQQKKERREARKLRAMPYTGSPPKTTIAAPEPALLPDEIETVA